MTLAAPAAGVLAAALFMLFPAVAAASCGDYLEHSSRVPLLTNSGPEQLPSCEESPPAPASDAVVVLSVERSPDSAIGFAAVAGSSGTRGQVRLAVFLCPAFLAKGRIERPPREA